jgi:lysophospholipase L1-like esterase
MKRTSIGILILIGSLLFLGVGTTAVSATVHILPLGDSLTKGMTDTAESASHPTYRYWLYNDLKAAGYDFDFVGSWTQPNFAYSFDQHNEAHGGYTTDGILNGASDDPAQGKLSQWLTGYHADIVLLMIGTNDCLHQIPTDQSISNIGAIIDQVRAQNPNAKILLASIPPTATQRDNLVALNARIPALASQKSTAQSPVYFVDQYSGFDGVNDNQASSGIHPDESGEKKLAAKWFSAIRQVLGGSAVTAPTAAPTAVATATAVPVQTVAVQTVAVQTVAAQPMAVQTVATTAPVQSVITSSSFGSSFGLGKQFVIGDTSFVAPTGVSQSSGSSWGTWSPFNAAPRDFSATASSQSLTPPNQMFVRWYPAGFPTGRD